MTDRSKVFSTDPFIIDEEGDVVINPDILVIESIRLLVKRSRGIVGDANGRKKEMAVKELTYIYHMVHYRSPYEGMPIRERKANAIKSAGLSKVHIYDREGKPADHFLLWENDSLCDKALNDYAAILYKDPIPLLVKNIKSAIYTGNDSLEYLNTRVSERLHDSRVKIDGFYEKQAKKQNITKTDKEHLEEIKQAENVDVEFIFTAFNNIREIIKDMPKMLSNIELTEMQVNKIEEAGAKIIRIAGGKTVSNRANPNRQKRVLEAKSGENKKASSLTRE